MDIKSLTAKAKKCKEGESIVEVWGAWDTGFYVFIGDLDSQQVLAVEKKELITLRDLLVRHFPIKNASV